MKNELLKEMMLGYQNVLNELEKEGAPAEATEILLGSINVIKSLLNREEALVEGKVTPVLATTNKVGLRIGIFKYKEICEMLGWKVYSGGTAKKSQFKELDTLCKYQKKGQKIIIQEIYQKKLIKEDKRRDKAIYVDPIKTILFYSLRSFKGELYFSVNKFIKVLEIFNQHYYGLENEEDYVEVSLATGIDIHTLKGFKVGSRREAQRIIERALRSMRSQRIIDYVEGRIIVTNDNEYRPATPEERRVIQRIEEDELKKLGCYNMASLKFKNLEKTFYFRIKQRFNKEGLEYVDYTFYGYSIVSHDRTISEQIELIEKEANVKELKELFKDRLSEFAEGNNQREVKKEYDKLTFGEPMLEINPIASNDYIPNFKKAIEIFI
nr:hypothetical protein [uncultured Clostridium sp.]